MTLAPSAADARLEASVGEESSQAQAARHRHMHSRRVTHSWHILVHRGLSLMERAPVRSKQSSFIAN